MTEYTCDHIAECQSCRPHLKRLMDDNVRLGVALAKIKIRLGAAEHLCGPDTDFLCCVADKALKGQPC